MSEKTEEIQRACRIGDCAILKRALEACPEGLNELDLKLGWSPLYRAVICGHLELVKFMLQRGADPNLRNRLGETPIHQSSDSGHYKITQSLLEKRADPNQQQSGIPYSDGCTPLHLTVAKGHYKVAWLLLKHKASPNTQNQANNKKLVQLLLRYDASPDITDSAGNRPIDLSRSQDIEKQLKFGSSEVATPSDLSLESIDPVLELPQDSVQDAKDLLDVILTVRNSGKDDSEDLIFNPEQIVSPQGFKVFNFEPKSQPLSRQCSSVMEPECETTVKSSLKNPPIRNFSFGHEPKKSLLYSWLKRMRLETAFDCFLESGYDDLDLLLGQMKSDLPLTLSHLKEIGISKPGHRVRILAGLEEAICDRPDPEDKENPRFSLSLCTVSRAVSGLALVPSLSQWLDGLKLKHLYKNFVEAGYDDLEHMLALMHTKYALTDEALKTEVNIYKMGHRHRLLFKLKQDCGRVTTLLSSSIPHEGCSMEKENQMVACESCSLM